MRERLLDFFYYLASRWSKHVIIGVAACTLVSGLLIPLLKISNSHSGLIPSTHPEQARYLEFLEEFGAANNVVVVLDGNPDAIKAAADAVERELLAETDYVKSVFSRVDLQKILEHAPFFVDKSKLAETVEFLSDNNRTVADLAAADGLPSLLNFIRRSMSGELPGGVAGGAAAKDGLRIFQAFLEEWKVWIEEPDIIAINYVSALEAGGFKGVSQLESDGYLLSHDKTMLFMFVQPVSPSDEASYLAPMDKALRAACERALASLPDDGSRVKIGFTGMPAHVLSEVEAIRTDVGRAGLISVVMVVGILLFGFRSFKTALIAVIPLSCGMIITLGAVALTVGRLNLVSSSFLAVLFGIGIDFAIYLVRRTEEELGNGLRRDEAVRIAVTVSGKGVLTGGLSTGLAFFAEGLSDFIGFSELGIIAGLGVLVVMLITFLMLPALLMLVGIKARSYHHVHKADKRWVSIERRFLYPLLLAAGLLAGVGVFACGRLGFDFNALHLLPEDCESTVYQLRMQNESDFQMTFAAVTADSLDELRVLEADIAGLATVKRVDSLSQMLPADQPEKAKLLENAKRLLPDKWFERSPTPGSGETCAAALAALSERLEVAQEDAFTAGHAGIVERLDACIAAADDIGEALGNEASAVKRTQAFEAALFDRFAELSDLIGKWRRAAPLTEAAYPPGLLDRFKSRKGRYVAYVFPNGSVWDLEFLDRFVADLKGITESVTGFPTTIRVNTRMLVNGLRQALIYGFVIIVLLLAIDFRDLRAVLLSLIPLTTGMLWVQAILLIAGREYNYASIAGLPLLLGLGVVYGVHIVHRWQENPDASAFEASITSGRGVAFAALTTVAGLSSIVFARHKGVSDFGSTIMMGILACLVAALVVLPATIDLIYLKPRNKEEAPE